jgi:hypothetical protein
MSYSQLQFNIVHRPSSPSSFLACFLCFLSFPAIEILSFGIGPGKVKRSDFSRCIMAPMLLEPPPGGAASKDTRKALPMIPFPAPSKLLSYKEPTAVCSDPSVLPSEKAPRRVRELWWLHGHPHSKRYSDPKLISLSALVRHDGLVYARQKAFLYPESADPTTPYRCMTWDEFDLATETIALSYAYQLRRDLQRANETHNQPTIALLGAGKTLEYFCTQLALQKLGVRVLLLAESNSTDALHHLLKSCEAVAIITDSRNSRTNANGLRKLHMIETIPQSSEVKYTEVDAVKFQDFGDIWERSSFIIHSSGSTGMPKPIIHTNRSMMLIARMYRLFQNWEIENWFLLFPL